MGRRAKPAKVKTKAARPLVREVPTKGTARVRELEKRLEETRALLHEKDRALTEAHAQATESREQQTAASEILKAISSSPTDVQPVFETIVTSAVRLCGGRYGALYRFDGTFLHVGALFNVTPEFREQQARRYPTASNSETLAGLAIQQRRTLQIHDVETDPDVPPAGVEAGRILGYRSQISVPMLRDGMVLGCLNIARPEPGPFSDNQVALLETFAAQAVIAIENVRLFREIERKSRELEVASQHKSEFLASMSHELRTPLNAIIGFSDVLLQGMFGEMTEKQTEYLQDILASGQHLLSLINDILDLSKIEAGRMEFDVAEFDLPTAVDDALLLMRERAGRRGITLERQVDERLGEIRADQRKVKQVLLNLLSNAVKFTPEGGRIDVRAGLSNGTAEISVTDTGIGIAPEDHDAVFEEFRQVGTADKKAEGTGLGLALCAGSSSNCTAAGSG